MRNPREQKLSKCRSFLGKKQKLEWQSSFSQHNDRYKFKKIEMLRFKAAYAITITCEKDNGTFGERLAGLKKRHSLFFRCYSFLKMDL